MGNDILSVGLNQAEIDECLGLDVLMEDAESRLDMKRDAAALAAAVAQQMAHEMAARAADAGLDAGPPCDRVNTTIQAAALAELLRRFDGEILPPEVPWLACRLTDTCQGCCLAEGECGVPIMAAYLSKEMDHLAFAPAISMSDEGRADW